MLDLVVVLAFAIYAVGSGLRARKQASRNLQEYFLAGKTIPGWKAGFSMAATQFAADTPLLVTGLVATAGVFALWRLWIYGLAFLMMAFVFAAGWRRGGVLTDAEFTEVRYSGRGVLPLRVLKAIYYGTVINCVVMAMVLVAAVRIAEIFLPWHRWLPAGVHDAFIGLATGLGLTFGGVTGLAPEIATANNLISILVVLGFTAMYSTTGGLRAVVNTDVGQFLLAMVGTGVYAGYVVAEVGGLGALSGRVVELYGREQAETMLSFGPQDASAQVLLPFLVIVGLQWFFQMNSDGTGYLAQRSMACRTDRDARTAGVVFAWVQIFLRSLFWLVIAVGLLVLHPIESAATAGDGFAAAREILFVTGIDELLPPGLRGLMLVGLLAALASTVDTHLNWGASYWSNDVYDRFVCRHWLRREPRGGELVIVARLSNILILAIAIAIMANLGSIQTAWFMSLLFGAGMGSVLVLRWLWERINLYSELAAIGASLITAPLLLLATGTQPEDEWIRLGTMALVTTVAAVGVTWITPRTSEAVRLRFYRRVRPVGFWAETARLAGDAPGAPLREFALRVRSLAFTAASLFLALLGVGQLVIRAPDASPAWSWAMVVIAAALVPVWLPAVRRRDLTIDRSASPDHP
ncbi:MAG: sodium:solute symporter family protein [Candidatus Krumholzibacteriia bacterium]